MGTSKITNVILDGFNSIFQAAKAKGCKRTKTITTIIYILTARLDYSKVNPYCSSILIENIEMKCIYTISNFDEICVLAQEALSNNVELEHTQLWDILNEFKKEEIYFWYGKELEDLDKINNFNDLVGEIENSLNDFSREFYIHYKPNSPAPQSL